MKPQKLDRYELLEELGCGGMATVYMARDTELDRQVAIKVLHPLISRRNEGVARFQREARALAALKHPNIVEIYDFFKGDADKPPFLVCELIKGPDLARFSARHGPPLPEMAALIIAKLAEALDAAHKKGVLHRDLKPENVLVAPEGRLVLTDFGIARIMGDETMTATGALMGSPAYMSPEQARSEPVDLKSDIFSLGVMLYKISTGKLPFLGKDPISTLTSILQGKYPSPLRVRGDLGPDLDRVIRRCLSGEKSRRYESAGDLAGELVEIARLGGLAHPEKELSDYLKHPKDHMSRLQAVVMSSTMERARSTARTSPALALSLCDRVMAFDPEHPEARQLLRRLSARQSLLKYGGAALAMVAVGIVATLLALPRSRPHDRDFLRKARSDTLRDAALAQPKDLDASFILPVDGSFEKPATAGSMTGPGRKERPTRTRVEKRPRIERPPPEDPAPDSGTASSRPRPETRDMARPALPAKGSIVLAIKPWCNAKIDGKAAGRSPRPTPITVAAGRHEVTCTQGSGQPFRRTVEVLPGQRVTVAGSVLQRSRLTLRLSSSDLKVTIGGAPYQRGTHALPAGRHRVVLIRADVPLKTRWLTFPAGRSCVLGDDLVLRCR